MPVSEFEQPARRIGGGRERGRIGLAAWIVGLGGIVVVGVGGRLSDRPVPAEAVVGSTPSAVAPATEDPQILVLTEPAGAEVRTVAVRVRGRAAESVERVDLVLLRGREAVGRQTVQPTRSGLFGGLFTLGAPRSAGTAVVVAIGRDRDGNELAAIRREVDLGALHVTSGRATPRPRLGEDGLVGSRGVDLPAAGEPASPRGVALAWLWPVGRLSWQVNPAQE